MVTSLKNCETKIRWLEQKIHRLGSDTDENHDQILDTKDESGLKTSPEKQDGVEQNKPIDKEKVVVAPKKLHLHEKQTTTKSLGIERALGERLMVWLGGIAIALSGFLLIKYSIENEMFSPSTRIIFAVLLGIGLIATGDYLNRKKKYTVTSEYHNH